MEQEIFVNQMDYALSLQEFHQKSLDWETQRLRYQQHVASLEAQRKAFAEQSDLFQVELMDDELFSLNGRRKDFWQPLSLSTIQVAIEMALNFLVE